ncbi:hypothetical protein ACKVMT_01400 [Halobacteriales archaeon Cl-PHB]
MKRYAELVFVVSLHLALFALLTKPLDPSTESGVTVVLGLASAVLLAVGLLYELGGDSATDPR